MLLFFLIKDSVVAKFNSDPSSNWSLNTFLALLSIIITIIVAVILYYLNKKKLHPTMSSIDLITDELGHRLLFTVISNNPAGSLKGGLYIKRKLWRNIFVNKQVIDCQVNKDFLNPSRSDNIPEYKILNQESFVAQIPIGLFNPKFVYKAFYSTSDGVCSEIIPFDTVEQIIRVKSKSKKHNKNKN